MKHETHTDPASSEAAQRACFLLHVRPDRMDEYVDAHKAVWDTMLQALTDSGWSNYSLFLDRSQGLVVGYFESSDVAAAMRRMSQHPVDALWQREMARYFDGPAGGTPTVLTEYFHLD